MHKLLACWPAAKKGEAGGHERQLEQERKLTETQHHLGQGKERQSAQPRTRPPATMQSSSGLLQEVEVKEEEEEQPEEGKARDSAACEADDGEGGKRKRLRKRQRSRGHGTLDMKDVEHAKLVLLETLDIKSGSINHEFGTFGALPVGSTRVWQARARLPRAMEPKTYLMRLSAGVYKFLVDLEHSRPSFLRDSKAVLIKVWLMDRELGLSTWHQKERVRVGAQHAEFSILVEPGCVRELRVQCLSESRLSHLRISSQLHKLKGACSPTSAHLQLLNEVVLDGVDQTDMIRKTRHERARSARIRRQQLEEQRRRARSTGA